MSDRPSTLRAILLGAVIVLLAAGIYAQSCAHGFVWDDDSMVRHSSVVSDHGLRKIWFSAEQTDYYPLTYMTFWWERRFWGEYAPAYHLVQLLVHVVNSLLVWKLFVRLGVPGAWLAGVVFAVHPVNVEAVAWVVQLKTCLALLFSLLALLAWVDFLRGRGTGVWMESILWFAGALLSKAGAVVMLPFSLLACAWWVSGRLSRTDALRTLPHFALSAIFGFLGLWFTRRELTGDLYPPSFDPVVRLANAGRAAWFYLGKVFAPVDLNPVYPFWASSTSVVAAVLPLAAVVVLVFAAWCLARTRETRAVVLGFTCYLAWLFPVLGNPHVYFLRYAPAADHYQYLALPWLLAPVCGLLAAWLPRAGRLPRAAAFTAAVVVMVLLAGSAWSRTRVFCDTETFFRDALSRNPTSVLANYQLAEDLSRRGRVDEAVEHYRAVLGTRPNEPWSLYQIAKIHADQGHVHEAIQELQAAVAAYPDFKEGHYGLADLLESQGRREEAISHFQECLRIKPDHSQNPEIRRRIEELRRDVNRPMLRNQ